MSRIEKHVIIQILIVALGIITYFYLFTPKDYIEIKDTLVFGEPNDIEPNSIKMEGEGLGDDTIFYFPDEHRLPELPELTDKNDVREYYEAVRILILHVKNLEKKNDTP